MDWEALSIIGLFVLTLGILLYVPARIWAKRKLRDDPKSHQELILTKVGWVLISMAILVILGGFSTQYLAPESAIGRFVKTSSGKFIYLAAVAFVFYLIESALKARGIKMIKEDR